MLSKYFVIINGQSRGSIEPTDRMRQCHDATHALDVIGNLNNGESVVRVFEVNERGQVTHYDVVFNGRLGLEAATTVMPG